MIDWGSAYKSTCHLYSVDPETWETMEELGKVLTFSIERNSTEDVPLLESCSFNVMADPSADPEEGWYRMVMHVTQGGSTERVPIITFFRQDGDLELKTGVTNISCTGYSVLKPADMVFVHRGYYVPRGIDGPLFIEDLLREAGVVAPIVREGKFELSDYMVFELNSSYLKCVWDVLDAAGWIMAIDPNGVITIGKKPSEPSLVLDRANARLVKQGVKKSFDNADVPNRYYAVSGDEYVVVENDLPDSRMSTVNRKVIREYVDTNPSLVDGESLDHYAMRMLKEASMVTHKYSYTRRYWPGVVPFSVVQASIGSIGFSGTLRVLSQSLSFDGGVMVSETAGYEEAVYDPWQLR